MPVDVAIKELIGEDLEAVREEQTKQNERFEKIEKALEELSGLVEEKGREAGTLREDVDKQRSDSEALDVRVKAIESFDVAALTKRVERLENDEEGGLGGVKQIHDKLEVVEKTLGEMRTAGEEASNIAKKVKSTTDEFELKLSQYGREIEDFRTTMDRNQETLEKMGGTSSDVTSAVAALKEAVARKYEALWQDVLNALEDFKTSQMDEMRRFNEQQSSRKGERNNLVSHALNVFASAGEERKKMAAAKDMLVAWKEQSWISARRRQGLWRLHCMAQRRHREVWNKWARRVEVEQLAESFREVYPPEEVNKLREAVADIKRQGDDLQVDCSSLDEKCKSLEASLEVKCSFEELDVKLKAQDSSLKDCIADTEKNINDEWKKAFNDVSDGLELENKRGQALDTRLSQQEEQTVTLGEAVGDCAKAKEMQTMMRDTLLVWNSIKQLDTAKADKKDLDAFAVESSSRDRLSVQRVESLEFDISSRVREEVQKTQERWSDLDIRVEESARQFQHWEQMWERLAGYVEDLVARISELQANQTAATTRSTSRTRDVSGGTYSSNGATLNRSHLAGNNASVNASTAATGNAGALSRVDSATSLEARTMWMGAKGVVDATLDQAFGQPPRARLIARPKSASRRGHDLGLDR